MCKVVIHGIKLLEHFDDYEAENLILNIEHKISERKKISSEK